MFPKKLLTGSIIVCSLVALMYLIIQLNSAYEEFLHWKSRETFLEEKLVELPFQDAVARKELGYGKKDELLYRFPEEKDISSE